MWLHYMNTNETAGEILHRYHINIITWEFNTLLHLLHQNEMFGVTLMFINKENIDISTSPMIHLICPQALCTTFFSLFSWVLHSSQEKLKTILM